MSVVFYGCVSLDGYLAGKDHDLSWLYESGSIGESTYEEFYRSMDITIMGRNTFDEVKKMGDFQDIYPTTTNYILTSRKDINTKGASTISGDIVEFVRTIEAHKNVWIIGGGKIVEALLKENLLDKIYLQIAPVIIGEGIRLFSEKTLSKRFKLLEVNKYGNFAELLYEKI